MKKLLLLSALCGLTTGCVAEYPDNHDTIHYSDYRRHHQDLYQNQWRRDGDHDERDRNWDRDHDGRWDDRDRDSDNWEGRR